MLLTGIPGMNHSSLPPMLPRQSLDTREYLPKESSRQVALGKLEDEISRMPDKAPAGFEEPLLETRQRPFHSV